MHDAQRQDSRRLTAPLAGNGRTLHRHIARAIGVCVFLCLMLFAASLTAQQVLMAPTVDVAFDRLEVSGPNDAIEVDYTISANDWEWTKDFGMDVFLGIYTPAGDQSWQLQRVEGLSARKGVARFGGGVGAGADQLGVCLVAASLDGGKLAPGMGYVCDEPLVVPASGTSVDFEKAAANVGLSFEPNVAEQPWYTVQRGFARADSEPGDAQPSRAEEEGRFFSHRAPSADADAPTRTRSRRGIARHGRDERPVRGYRSESMVIYTPGYLPGLYDRGGRFDTDHFRRHRLKRRRMFGPLDGFDAKFNQDMFDAHPEGVFYNQPIVPGYFGRDAFGRDLNHGYGAPPRVQPRIRRVR